MKHIAVMTSGGDAPGMNPAIHAVTRTALNHHVKVSGVKQGYAGLVRGNFINLDAQEVSGMGRRGGTFLQTSRCPEFKKPEVQQEAIAKMKDAGIEGLVVIGGDGSLTGAKAIHSHGFPVIGMPGTIDNDLGGTDIGIGVDTALNTIVTLADMVKDTASSHERCFIIEVMGRSSGYLAAMSAISTQSHVAVIPEFDMNMHRIVNVVQKRFSTGFKNTVIILAEGVCSAFDMTRQLVAACDGIIANDIRSTVLGHVQRGGAPSSYDRLLAAELGEYAVCSLLEGTSGCMAGKIAGKRLLSTFDEAIQSTPRWIHRLELMGKNLGVEFGDKPKES